VIHLAKRATKVPPQIALLARYLSIINLPQLYVLLHAILISTQTLPLLLAKAAIPLV